MQSEYSEHTDGPAMERLHPFTLLHRFIVSFPALVIILLPVLRGPDTSAWITVAVVLVYGVSVVPIILLQYLRFRYAVTPEEVVIHSGVFTYKHRNIPIERIQNIEIEQSLLPRLLGLAKVKIETAGSRSTEGVIEFVSLERARAIRESVKAFQRAQRAVEVEAEGDRTSDATAERRDAAVPAGDEDARRPPRPGGPDTGDGISGRTPARTASPSTELLHAMSLGRVLLSGAFRFSLLYIAVIFTATEYLGIQPDEMARWITGNRLEAFNEALRTSPALIVLSTILIVGVLAWITGILTNLSRYFGFRITYEEGKLHTRYGLLTVSEGTIPLHKIQALIIRTNPLMRAFGWYRLEVQTMGFDPNDRGYRVAAPFARMEEVRTIALRIRPFSAPEAFHSVSRLMIRRAFIRYTLVLLVASAVTGYFWEWGPWLIFGVPLVYAFAVRQYRNHGYAVEDSHLFVRRGVFRQYTWILPFERFQVFYLTQSLFQRRLRLQSFYVDTPGGASMTKPVVTDLPEGEATRLFESVYVDFQRLFGQPMSVSTNPNSSGNPT